MDHHPYTPIGPHYETRHPGSLKRFLLATPILLLVASSWRWSSLMHDDLSVPASLTVTSELSKVTFHGPIPYSTNTPYALAGSFQPKSTHSHVDANGDKDNWNICRLVQINGLYRHGTRYPMEKDYIKMNDLLQQLQTSYNATLPHWLQTYSFPYPQNASELLSPSGANEMRGLGHRARQLADRFNLSKHYDPTAFVFEHTHVLRTKQSAHAFVEAFFPDLPTVDYKCQPEGHDIPLRFFSNCPKYLKYVRESTNVSIQSKAFEASARATHLVQTLQRALRLPPAPWFTFQHLKSIYEACAYDVALFHDTTTHAAWCSLLDRDSLFLLDFHSDLKKFYECGPGFDISVAIAAPLLVDMLGTMKRGQGFQGYFRFAHAETILPLLCLVGLCPNKTLLVASWTDDDIQSRDYKVAHLSPFAANLAFHVYHCDKDNTTQMRIQVLVNEVQVALPACEPKAFCTLEDLETHFADALTYDFEKACQL
ncbi:Aste57867_24292 [Aphanomyces stellatus]|uniref:Multiple inositol polyphosphate phosphatase 1 n=1 Tax=Aphanomyces stellatus TaxID=120398 RepID=A0A485LRN3_9STRA|nr:hypothetical protein As57867_024217 [Aphanomyces stellatus]VFU00932.1 Aste57867_24292 [Aphanomyces stellatus]